MLLDESELYSLLNEAIIHKQFNINIILLNNDYSLLLMSKQILPSELKTGQADHI
jgi:hypothetical protein